MDSFCDAVKGIQEFHHGESTKPPTSLLDIYQLLRPVLDKPARLAFRKCCVAARAAHDREETAVKVVGASSLIDKVSASEMPKALSGILSRGCKPRKVSLWLDLEDAEAQAHITAALACFPAMDVSSVIQVAVRHLDMSLDVTGASIAAAAPRLASLYLTACPGLGSLPFLAAAAQHTLRQLCLESCGICPEGLGSALTACHNLEHLTVLLPASANPTKYFAPFCSTLTRLTQLRSLSMDLRLPSHDDETYGGDTMGLAEAGALARGFTCLSRLSCLEVGDGGALPHPEWRLELLHSLAGLPGLAELSWRRLECDPEATFALSLSSSLTSLVVERFCTVAPVTAVALAAAAAAAAAAEAVASVADAVDTTQAAPGNYNMPTPRALAAAAAAKAAAALAAPGTVRSTGRTGANRGGVVSSSQQQQLQQFKLLLLPLPPRISVLRTRYSGLRGMSLAAVAGLQLPPGQTAWELRNPKLEINDGDVGQPAAARLLPEAALALGMGLSKLAIHCPGLSVLRIINETRQRNSLAGPAGWDEAQGGDGGAAGGGHAPWLVNLGKLRQLKRLTLSGLRLGRIDVETLERHVTTLEELYLVPLGSVSSAAVMVLRRMNLRRLSLPYERYA